MTVEQVVSFIVVGALWGCTNPLIKRGSSTAATSSESGGQHSFKRKLYEILLNWRFVLPFLLNQSGSVVYVYLLGSSEISKAVPICNALTFLFTALTSHYIGEVPKRPFFTYTGIMLLLLGIVVCIDSTVS